jgi:hypothetical protein
MVTKARIGWVTFISVAALTLGHVSSASAQSPADLQPAPSATPAEPTPLVPAEPVVKGENLIIEPSRLDPASRRWFFAAGGTLLRRSRQSSAALVIDEDTLSTLLTTDALSFDFEVGPYFNFGLWVTPTSAIEATYYGLNPWEADAVVTGDNNLSLPGDLALATFDFFAADVMSVSYDSDFNNVEVNYRWAPRPIVSFLVGVRYLDLRENLNINSFDIDTGTSDYRIDTYNHMVGGQIGAAVGPQVGRFSGALVGKAGIFGNFAGQNSFVGDRDNQDVLRDAAVRSYGGAFVLEGGLEGAIQVSEAVSVQLGYHVVWLDRVALAAEHIDFTDTATSGLFLNERGDTYYHGARAAVQVRWGRPRR